MTVCNMYAMYTIHRDVYNVYIYKYIYKHIYIIYIIYIYNTQGSPLSARNTEMPLKECLNRCVFSYIFACKKFRSCVESSCVFHALSIPSSMELYLSSYLSNLLIFCDAFQICCFCTPSHS